MITTVLLDLDDTLLGNPTQQFIERYFAALNGHLNETLHEPMMRAVRAVMERGDPALTNSERFFETLLPALPVSRAEFEESVTAFYRDVFPALREVTTLRPVARRLVDGLLARGYTVVVATNPFFPREAVEQRLAWAGVPVDEVPFALVTHLENMHFTKDHPEYYEETLARVGAAPSEAVMVGDDWYFDIVSASRAGLHTYWLGVPGTEPDTSGTVHPSGCGTLDDFARLALDEGWLERQVPRPLEPRQIAPRLTGTLAALLGAVREQPGDDRAALLSRLVEREQTARERLQALARGESAPPAVGPVPVADAPDFTEAVARLIAERRTTIDWLATLDDAAWDENLLHAADALAADDRAIITKLQSS